MQLGLWFLLLLWAHNSVATSCATIMQRDSDQTLEDAQASQYLSQFELVAEMVLERQRPGLYRSGWETLSIAEARVTHYYRQPLDEDGHYRATASYPLLLPAVARSPGDRLLVMAYPEDETSRQRRLSPAAASQIADPLPADIHERLWHAHSECIDMVRPDLPSTEALRAALVRATLEAAPTGTLSLQMQERTDSYGVGHATRMQLQVESLDDGTVHSVELQGDTLNPINLPAGRYQIHWPEISGARVWCGLPDPACRLSLQGGLHQYATIYFEGAAQADVQVLDAGGRPVELLAQLRLHPLQAAPAGQPELVDVEFGLEPSQSQPMKTVASTPRIKLRAAAYELRLRAGKTQPACAASPALERVLSMDVLRANAINDDGEDELADVEVQSTDVRVAEGVQSITLDASRYLIRAYLPDADAFPLVRLSLTRDTDQANATLSTDCASMYWNPRWQGNRAEILVPRGQVLSLARYCSGCISELRSYTMDQDRVVHLDTPRR